MKWISANTAAEKQQTSQAKHFPRSFTLNNTHLLAQQTLPLG